MSTMEEQHQRSYYPPSQQPPVSQLPQEPRPQRARTQSHFSFKSNRSNSSSNGSRPPKEHLKESVTEKRRNRISQTTKANPNAAMEEAQPAVQAMEASTLGTLRGGALKDIYGNLITDPDRSNPTRSRMERPLDTIRGFDEQIEKNYWEKRQSIHGPNGYENNSGNSSRRNSGYGHESYFAGRQSYTGHSTPGGYYRGNDSSHYDSHSSPQFHPPRRYHPGGRPSLYGRGTSPHNRTPPHGVYPNQGYHQSLDTVNTGASGSGSGSGSQGFSNSEMWAGSADTSIEDGSMGMHRKDPSGMPADPYAYEQGYGHNGWNNYRRSNGSPERQPAPAVQSPYQDQQYGYNDGGYGNGYGNGVQTPQVDRPAPPPKNPSNGYAQAGANGVPAPAPPPKSTTLQPVRTGASAGGLQPSASTKRKSWFKRRFSKD